jgi:hypothetical protein
MITNQDRSKWFGASDTSMVMGNWDTRSFGDWWLVKLGIFVNNHKSWMIDCGNIIERHVIQAIEKLEGVKISIGTRPYHTRRLRLRVNYDGIRPKEIVEIKTSEKGFKKVPKNYWQQCQVLMYRMRKKKTGLYLYYMKDEDYLNPYFPDIDVSRIVRFDVEYDANFIKDYLPRLKFLKKCLKKKIRPTEEDYERWLLCR